MANTIDSMLGFLGSELNRVEKENGWTHYKFTNGLDVAFKNYGDVYFESTNIYMSGKTLMVFQKTELTKPVMVNVQGIYPHAGLSTYHFGGLTARKVDSTTYKIDALVIGAHDYTSILCKNLSVVAIGTWK